MCGEIGTVCVCVERDRYSLCVWAEEIGTVCVSGLKRKV